MKDEIKKKMRINGTSFDKYVIRFSLLKIERELFKHKFLNLNTNEQKGSNFIAFCLKRNFYYYAYLLMSVWFKQNSQEG